MQLLGQIPITEDFMMLHHLIQQICELGVSWCWFQMQMLWLSGRVLNSRLKGRWFETYRRHCIVSYPLLYSRVVPYIIRCGDISDTLLLSWVFAIDNGGRYTHGHICWVVQVVNGSELILGCGSVIITLFLQYWPKISSSLRSYFRTVPRFGAFPVILCVFLITLFTFRSI